MLPGDLPLRVDLLLDCFAFERSLRLQDTHNLNLSGGHKHGQSIDVSMMEEIVGRHRVTPQVTNICRSVAEGVNQRSSILPIRGAVQPMAQPYPLRDMVLFTKPLDLDQVLAMVQRAVQAV
jgi:hypothetical protein